MKLRKKSYTLFQFLFINIDTKAAKDWSLLTILVQEVTKNEDLSISVTEYC